MSNLHKECAIELADKVLGEVFLKKNEHLSIKELIEIIAPKIEQYLINSYATGERHAKNEMKRMIDDIKD